MADAKSRYEIVNELTDKKQKCFDEISQIDAAIVENEQKHSQLVENNARAIENLKREQVERLRDFELARSNLAKSQNERKLMLERKVSAYDEAIKALQEISDKSVAN